MLQPTTTIERLEKDVELIANTRTPAILVETLRKLRDNIVWDSKDCLRHGYWLQPRIKAEIDYHRAKKRARYHWHGLIDTSPSMLTPSQLEDRAREHRDQIKEEYRAAPCTCLIPHR